MVCQKSGLFQTAVISCSFPTFAFFFHFFLQVLCMFLLFLNCLAYYKHPNLKITQLFHVLQATMLVEGHMDDGITFSRAQEEESRSARVIRKCQSLFNRFTK